MNNETVTDSSLKKKKKTETGNWELIFKGLTFDSDHITTPNKKFLAVN